MPAITEKRRALVRENIELAAIRCFVRKGFHGTTTREIAGEAGVSTGGVYAHYPGKTELFAASVERYRLIFASPDNPLWMHFGKSEFPDDIEALAAAIEELIRTHRDFWLLWYVDVLEFGGKHFADSFLQDVPDHPSLRARFEVLRASGRLRVDPELAFGTVYLHLFNHLIVEVLFRGRPEGVAQQAQVLAIADISLRGILN
jgi:AcrR family transcriptional regulator